MFDPGTVDWVGEIRRRAESGVLTGVSEEQLREKALDAVAFIEDGFPTAVARIGAGTLSARTFCRIVTDMVLRVVRNPEGFKSESDATYSYTSAATVASGDLWIPDKDAALLRGRVASGVPSSVRLAPDRGWSR